MVAQADQGRVLSGGQAFSSDQVLAALYSLANSRPSDFHDIIYGYNGYSAGPGYDLVTGLGTPDGSQLVPDLAYSGLSSRPKLTSVVVSPSNPSVDEGFAQQFTATGTFASGVTQSITSSVAWASSNPAVATIDGAGLAATHAAGTSAITASLEGVTSPAVMLTSLPLVSLVVAPGNPSVDEGFAQQFTATGTFAGGSTQNLTSFVTWASSKPAVATIDASGLATTHAAGTSVITASLYGVTSPGDVLTTVPLVALAVAPNNPYVPVLLSVPFTVTSTYGDGSTHQLPGTSVAWASSKPAVATINSAGLATAKTLGSSVITASLYGVTSPGDVFTAVAPTFVVNTTADDLNYAAGRTNLREAILAANAYPGHTVTFDPAVFTTAMTITLTLGQLEMEGTTGTETIKGPTKGVTVSGNNTSRVFEVDPGVNASVSGMTITRGSAFNGGGLYNNGGNLTLTDCTVSGNSASNNGGGLYGPSNASGAITLTDCTVSGNFASNNGGGLDARSLDMAVRLTNSTISGNSSFAHGGGMQAFGTATLTNCTVNGNSSALYGGGLDLVLGTATLTNCTVSGNSTTGIGGGLDVASGTVVLINCTVSGNSSYLAGGGLDLDLGTATLTNCTVSGNSSTGPFAGGGGLYDGGALTLTNCTISGNSVPGGLGSGGGVLFGFFSTAALTNCTISGNSAVVGGGVLNDTRSGGTAMLTNCTVSGNASGYGGGLANYAGAATLTNCTVSGNSSAVNGGGIANGYLASTALTNCTVSGNSSVIGGGIANYGILTVASSSIVKNAATFAGGGISTTGGSVTITNSLINANQVNSPSTALGGGIDCENSTLALTNCTVNANQTNGANAYGGGIYALGSTVDATNSTINDNEANGTVMGEGGGIYAFDSTLTLVNTNVKGNKATTAYNNIFVGP
jgi:hypothetical protein